jgi:Domain of unknown function (DUF1918)
LTQASRRDRGGWWYYLYEANGGEDMKLEVGNRIKVEAESTERSPRTGVVEEVVSEAPSPRYRIRWDDGHESIYAPAAGAVGPAEPTGKP